MPVQFPYFIYEPLTEIFAVENLIVFAATGQQHPAEVCGTYSALYL
jgi:hypothetical protein